MIETQVKERLKAATVAELEKEDIGWRKLTGNASRNLSPLKQDRMIEIGFWLWENNPLARWIIEIAKDFILAEGLPYETKHKDIKTVLDDFWSDPLNKMDLYLEKHVRELFIYGELCFPVYTGKQTGRVRLGYTDPAQIKEVMTDPENAKMVIGIMLKGTLGLEGRKLRTILPEDAETIVSPAARRLRETYTDGECFFFAINNVTNSPRGRSELLSTADWLDAYEQFLFDYADKWPLMNSFVWDLLVESGDEAAIKKQMDAFTKKPGSIFGHNEKVKLSASAPDLKAVDAETGARIFRNHILGSHSYPEHWFGGGGNVNMATAVEMGTPAYKALSSKQRYVKFILESILHYVVESARKARYLTVTDEEARAVSIITPELTTKDVAKYAAAIQQVTAALATAELQGWIDKDTARKIFALAIGHLGAEIDSTEVKKAVDAEAVAKAHVDYTNNVAGA
ncbi:hypothetical protein EPN18_07970 [bacterium]|nr:MAG: hypothetical protein EPN18_07970 [bacterium]